MKSRILYTYSVFCTCWKLGPWWVIYSCHTLIYVLVFPSKSLFGITLILISITLSLITLLGNHFPLSLLLNHHEVWGKLMLWVLALRSFALMSVALWFSKQGACTVFTVQHTSLIFCLSPCSNFSSSWDLSTNKASSCDKNKHCITNFTTHYATTANGIL